MQLSIEQILSSYDDRAPLAQASTIPAAWYVDPRIADLERQSVFSKTWQLVARTEQVNAQDSLCPPRLPMNLSWWCEEMTACCALSTMFAVTMPQPW